MRLVIIDRDPVSLDVLSFVAQRREKQPDLTFGPTSRHDAGNGLGGILQGEAFAGRQTAQERAVVERSHRRRRMLRWRCRAMQKEIVNAAVAQFLGAQGRSGVVSARRGFYNRRQLEQLSHARRLRIFANCRKGNRFGRRNPRSQDRH